jgi:16S rRNA (adenine1518-N6/adenine1519-N6)-dimethyltransferase
VIRAKKSLGQHFLADKNIARKIVQACELVEGDTVLEIGPGTGALTELLAQSPAKTIAIDIDQRSVEHLKTRIETESWANVEVVHADILKSDIRELFGTRTLKVIGNLPYNITSPILFRLFEQRESIASAVLMTQREVAQRICGSPGSKDFGILAVLCQTHAACKSLFRVSPNVFVPKPDVWSAVIKLEFQTERLSRIASYPEFVAVVKGSFAKRRKTLGNALKHAGLFPDPVPPALVQQFGRRAEQLSVEEFIDLANILSEHE